MFKNFFYVILIFATLFLSGCEDRLAHHLTDLSNTYWQCKNRVSRTYGYVDNIEQIIFYNEVNALYRYQSSVVDYTQPVPDIDNDEIELIYKYDSTAKQGILIFEDSREEVFEIRGNLLFSYDHSDNVTIYKMVKR